MGAWNNWYHITIGTYGTWLPGDPRGWREVDHHEHVEGDYKKPPTPSKFNMGRWENSKRVMAHDPYIIKHEDKPRIGELILTSLALQKIQVSSIAVSVANVHMLVQCPDNRPKVVAGHVKRHVVFNFAPVVNSTTRERRPIFEKDCGAKPIRDVEHGKNAHGYILKHYEKENAWVWSHRPADLSHIGPPDIVRGLSGGVCAHLV